LNFYIFCPKAVQEKLDDTKGVIEAINPRRADNTMVKRKRTV